MKLNSKYFVRPPNPSQEGQELMLSVDRDSIRIHNSLHKEPTNMSVIKR